MKLCLLIVSLFSVIAQAQVAPAPQEAFKKTLAEGYKKWKAEGLFVVSTTKNGKTETQKLNCVSIAPVTLDGKFPNVIFSMGDWTCAGVKDLPRPFTMARILFSKIQYSAYHIPAMPQEPNQFRLDLVTRPTYPQMQKPQSLNANIRGQVFMDVIGEKREPLMLGVTYYGASVLITTANEMTVEFSEEIYEGRVSTSNTVSGQVKLTPVN